MCTVSKEVVILSPGEIEFIPNNNDFGILCNLPKLLPVQHSSKDDSHNIVSNNIVPCTSFRDEDCMESGDSSIPMDLDSYERYLMEGYENHKRIVDLRNPSKTMEILRICELFKIDGRCNITYNNYVASMS